MTTSDAKKARKREAAKTRSETAKAVMDPPPPARDDEDPSASGGSDNDNPSKQNGQLQSDFKRILKIAFRIKGDAKHEVFEALQFEGIYTWELFIETELKLIRKLTKATKNNRVPVTHTSKAKLKSLLGLYLHTQYNTKTSLKAKPRTLIHTLNR